jgi:four helix bundle protein
VVYIKAYELAMRIFEISKRFPREEQYAITSQLRRCSRSVSHQVGKMLGSMIQNPDAFLLRPSDS